MTLFKNFLVQDEGVTAIEYGMIAALIAVVIIGTLELIGTGLLNRFDQIRLAIVGTA